MRYNLRIHSITLHALTLPALAMMTACSGMSEEKMAVYASAPIPMNEIMAPMIGETMLKPADNKMAASPMNASGQPTQQLVTQPVAYAQQPYTPTTYTPYTAPQVDPFTAPSTQALEAAPVDVAATPAVDMQPTTLQPVTAAPPYSPANGGWN